FLSLNSGKGLSGVERPKLSDIPGLMGGPSDQPIVKEHPNGGLQITDDVTRVAEQPKTTNTHTSQPKSRDELKPKRSTELPGGGEIIDIDLPMFNGDNSREPLVVSSDGKQVWLCDEKNRLHRIQLATFSAEAVLQLDERC